MRRTRHDATTIALHWAVAGLVVLQFLLAEFWDFVPRPAHHLMVLTHMSLGIVLTGLFLFRLVWRTRPGHSAFRDPGGLGVAARAGHHVLYLLLAVELPLGFFTRWTDNHALSFFGLAIPSPFGRFSEATGRLVDHIHDYAAWTIIILAGAHAAASLFHHYVRRDGVLRRMLPGV